LLAPDYSEEITIGSRRAIRNTQSSIAAVGSIQYGLILTERTSKLACPGRYVKGLVQPVA